MSQQAVSAGIIQNSTVGLFPPKQKEQIQKQPRFLQVILHINFEAKNSRSILTTFFALLNFQTDTVSTYETNQICLLSIKSLKFVRSIFFTVTLFITVFSLPKLYVMNLLLSSLTVYILSS
jgi:hypothetical protein